MAVTIVTELPAETASTTLAEIHAISTASAALTPRSMEVLTRALEDGRLVIGFVDGTLAGWGLKESLGRSVYELGMTYTKPEFRGHPVFDGVTRRLVEPGATYVFATYDPAIVAYMRRRFGFRESSLGEVLWRSRGRFLFKRLDRASRSSIGARLSVRTPLYAILG